MTEPVTAKVDAKVLLDALNRVKHAAATDEARPILMSVVIEGLDDDSLRVSAADNYRIATMRVWVHETSAAFPRVVVPIEDGVPVLVALLKAAPKGSSAVLMANVASDKPTLAIDTTIGSGEVRLVYGTYPDIDAIIGPSLGYKRLISVNPKYLADAGKATPDAVIEFRFEAWDKPILITANDSDYAELVMAVRVPADGDRVA